MNDSLSGCAGGSNVLRCTTNGGNTWSAANIHVPVSIETIAFDRYGNGVLTGQGGSDLSIDRQRQELDRRKPDHNEPPDEGLLC